MTKNEFFIEKSKLIHSDKYDYTNTNYINNSTKVEIICKEHGSFFQKPLYHKKHGCPKCGRISMKNSKVNSNWLDDFIKAHGDKYDYSKVIYVGASKKVEIICKKHGSFLQRPMDHKLGAGCKRCGVLKSRRVKNNIIYDFIKTHGDKYDYSKVDYKDTKTKVEIICKEHGSFFQRPSSHREGSGCSKCKNSKGEKEIMCFLDDHNIKYITQYKFDDCLSINLQKKLSFDFFLPEKNICIEYDGIQHFTSIEKWGGVERYNKQKMNDKIKDEYCIENNIKLLRIPYTNFDSIKKILYYFFY